MSHDNNAPIEPELHATPHARSDQPHPPKSHGSAIDQILSGELKYTTDTDSLVKQSIGKLDFELGIVYLEAIVKKIENNPGNLDQNTQLYAVGELLRLHCDNKLKLNEAKVEQIIKDTQGQATDTEPLDL